MGQNESQPQSPSKADENFVVVKQAPVKKVPPIPYTAYSVSPGSSTGKKREEDTESDVYEGTSKYNTRKVHPLIQGSQDSWLFRPPGVTGSLERLEREHPTQGLGLIQAHFRRSHLLVDCAQVKLGEKMRNVRQLSATVVLAFTNEAATINRDLKTITALVQNLEKSVEYACNVTSKLLDVIHVIRNSSGVEMEDLDHGAALYRHGLQAMEIRRERTGSKAAAVLKELSFSPSSSQKMVGEESQIRYWLDEIMPNWEEKKQNRIKRAKVCGVPPSIRSEVWKKAIGNHLNLTKKDWDDCCDEKANTEGVEKSIGIIEHDLPRTFHHLELFMDPSESTSVDLANMLCAFARYNQDLGYVQGMSFLGAMLLINMEGPFNAWVAMNNMLDNHLMVSLFRMDVPNITKHTRVYEMILSNTLPDVYAHLQDFNITTDHYALGWFMTMFAKKLPLHTVSRVWDCYLLGAGEVYLYQVAVALIKMHKDVILNADFEECERLLKSPVTNLKEREFFDCVESVKVNSHWYSVVKKIDQHAEKVSPRTRPKTPVRRSLFDGEDNSQSENEANDNRD